MSDYFWPRSPITELHKSYITQIQYSIHQDDGGCCPIKYMNLLDEKPSLEHHAYVPAFYKDHIKRFFWRHYLVITLYEHYEQKKLPKYMGSNFLPYLLNVIVHMDNVIESIIRPCQTIGRSEVKNYRSQDFEDYLIAEYIIGRHDPNTMDDYRDVAMSNIEQLPLPHNSVWDNEYARRLPPLLSGFHYDYDINRVPKKDYKILLKSVFEWYTKKLDMEWLKSTGTLRTEGEGIGDKNQHEGADVGIDDKDEHEGEGEGNPGMEMGGGASPPPNQLAMDVHRSAGQKRSCESNAQSNRPLKTPRVTSFPVLVGFDEEYGAYPFHRVGP